MRNTERSLALLKQIADANGTDMRLFFSAKKRPALETTSQRKREDSRSEIRKRFVKAFHALPSHESRLQAVWMLESLAHHANAASHETAR